MQYVVPNYGTVYVARTRESSDHVRCGDLQCDGLSHYDAYVHDF